MIIGAAIATAISQTINRFRKKKLPEKKVDFKSENFTLQHNCSDCSAECMLRDTARSVIKENVDLCKKIENQRKL